MDYNKKHTDKISNSVLPNSDDKTWKRSLLAETEINISGKVCKVSVLRGENGNIEIVPNEEYRESWLKDGTTTEGYGDEIIIGQFNHND